MKSVLISIQPKWVEKIAKGEKTIEVRKTRPKIETPFKCYIYCTQGRKREKMCFGAYTCYIGNGKVMGEFVCDKVYNLVQAGAGIMFADENLNLLEPQLFRDMSCLTDNQLSDYLGNKDGYGWHINDLVIYDKPKELSEFYARCNIPESKCKLCDNCFDREDYYGRHYAVKKLTRPFQSWGYIEV